MATSIQEVSLTAHSVSGNAAEAAQGTNGVFSHIREVSGQVHGQSAGIQKVNSASKALAMVAVELNSVVRKFKLA
ncbi:MAG: hypothetical protein OEV92_13855, partial [Nitrospinota bacterium]|nr:hypothetical protein [Nitrospinota bacterium]